MLERCVLIPSIQTECRTTATGMPLYQTRSGIDGLPDVFVRLYLLGSLGLAMVPPSATSLRVLSGIFGALVEATYFG